LGQTSKPGKHFDQWRRLPFNGKIWDYLASFWAQTDEANPHWPWPISNLASVPSGSNSAKHPG
jgi:hypothetical protein